ncbi:MAG: deoxyhypusine synthase family protein [Syntrophobacteraceae bacterium]
MKKLVEEPQLVEGAVKAVEVKKDRRISDLLLAMKETGFQGRKLGEVCETIFQMISSPDVTVMLGYAGALSVAGQWKVIAWMLEQGYIDILVPTGANISEDIIEAMGRSYYLCSHHADDEALFRQGINRYYDVAGREDDYVEMTELIATFIETSDTSVSLSSREFLRNLGLWLGKRGIRSLLTIAAEQDVPVFCPAVADSPFGDGALLAKSKGIALKIDAMKDYCEFMSLADRVDETGVIYLGGGVPKDFIQLFAATANLLFPGRVIPNRKKYMGRANTDETYYPHKYAVQITTDSPQWGGLSGCTFDEAVSWGKEKHDGRYVQCYCDATIALPLISHALAELMVEKRPPRRLGRLFPNEGKA